jgi:hypothetical protein
MALETLARAVIHKFERQKIETQSCTEGMYEIENRNYRE